MIHVITKHNKHLYGSILTNMFKVRHKVFVEDRQWKKLEKSDGLEIDQFDTDDTTYFLKLDPDMNILGGIRIYPTTVDTQLNTVFEDWCQLKKQPCDPTHYEWSRYFITDLNYRSASGKAVHYELYTGLLDYARELGIKSFSGFIDMPTFHHIGRLPWDLQQIGLPSTYGGTHGEPTGQGLAIQVPINDLMVRKTKIAWRMRKPVLSLSLGEHTPYKEIGFKPEVVLQMADFVAEHPDHVDIVAVFAEMLQDIDPDQRDAAKGIIKDLSDGKAKIRRQDTAITVPTASEIPHMTMQ